MDLKHNYFSIPCFLLGYDAKLQIGKVFTGNIEANFAGTGKFLGKGNIAAALTETIEVARSTLVHSICGSDQILYADLTFICDYPGINIRETRSCGLAFVVSFLNLLVLFSGKSRLNNFAASGIVRLDGSILPVLFAQEKAAAFTKIDPLAYCLIVDKPIYKLNHIVDSYSFLIRQT